VSAPTETAGLPLPDITDPDFAPYWALASEHRLAVARCVACRTPRWPPRPSCARCHDERSEPLEVRGDATLYSWTVVHRAALPGFAALVPYAVGVVALADVAGVRMLGRLIDVTLPELTIGMPMRVSFVELGTVTLPCWTGAAPRSAP
jgi:uncharacterized OB-fold protein